MAKTSEAPLRCSSCGKTFPVRVYTLINTRTDSELKEKVRDGSLFITECPYCGAHNIIDAPVIYHDPDGHLMIWMLPDGALAEEQEKALEAALTAESPEGYTLRRVGDVGSLIEKVNIHEAGLDDTVVEMCKYLTRLELSEKNAELAAAGDVPFKFYRFEGADNALIFTYPLGGEMKGATVGLSVYEDCRGILSRNPSVKPAGGFAEVDARWLSRFFR